jgi:hypothetical protein
MDMLTEYFALQAKIYEYFGYEEDWVAIPINDSRIYFWHLEENANGSGQVKFSESKEDLENDCGDVYADEIYTQRYLSKWVYRGEQFTMVCVNTNVDGNKFLRIFDNSKEV